MKKLFTQEELDKAGSKTKLPLRCKCCRKTFYKDKGKIQSAIAGNTFGNIAEYCSLSCAQRFKYPLNIIKCKQCDQEFHKTKGEMKKSKSGNNFCSKSCAATYNNTHKKTGTRRSKLEVWLESELPRLFPDLEFHFNRKDAINSELDIYIPSLKLAFELNGIYHYEPIHGPEKLASIQNNDERKFQACLEVGIELCIIDSSGLIYFKPQKAKHYLQIIESIILCRINTN